MFIVHAFKFNKVTYKILCKTCNSLFKLQAIQIFLCLLQRSIARPDSLKKATKMKNDAKFEQSTINSKMKTAEVKNRNVIKNTTKK